MFKIKCMKSLFPWLTVFSKVDKLPYLLVPSIADDASELIMKQRQKSFYWGYMQPSFPAQTENIIIARAFYALFPRALQRGYIARSLILLPDYNVQGE